MSTCLHFDLYRMRTHSLLLHFFFFLCFSGFLLLYRGWLGLRFIHNIDASNRIPDFPIWSAAWWLPLCHFSSHLGLQIMHWKSANLSACF